LLYISNCFFAILEAAHDAAIVQEDVRNLIGGVVAIFNLATGVADSECIRSTPNLNSKEAVARDRFLARSLPVLRFPFARVAISLAMSSSEQGVPTPGNMASNLVMVDVMVLVDESTGAGIEVPDET